MRHVLLLGATGLVGGELLQILAAEESIAIAIDRVAECYVKGGRAIYLGAGTSGRIATMDAAEMPPTFGIEPDRFVALVSGGFAASARAVEDAEDDPHQAVVALNELRVDTRDVVIGLAASGTTPYVLGGIRHARQKGIWTCGIANNKAYSARWVSEAMRSCQRGVPGIGSGAPACRRQVMRIATRVRMVMPIDLCSA